MEERKDLVLLKETLAEAGGYIERVKANKRLVVDPLLQGDYNAALTQMADLIEGLGWLSQVLASARDLLGLYDQDLENRVSGFNEYLKQVSGALESQDYVLLGDLLEYGLDDNLKHYTAVFNVILEALDKTGFKNNEQ